MRSRSRFLFANMSHLEAVLSVLILISFNFVEPSTAQDHEWDLLIFTQSWPATVCKEWKHDPSHSCSFPSRPDSWTIHGIWPTKLGTIGPEYCNRSWNFDPEKIKPIEPYLMQAWANIETETSTYRLWSHEWTKHGTCAAQLEAFNSELKYFSKGLDWLKVFSMTDVLAKAGIVPSNDKQYSVGAIHNAVHSNLGFNPAIECRTEDGRQWLDEIRICFDKALNLINCDGIRERKFTIEGGALLTVLTNCHTSEDILYPHDHVVNEPDTEVIEPDYAMNQPRSIYVQLYKLVSWLQWFTF